MISLKSIHKIYKQGSLEVPVLHDISIEVEHGEFVSIMGPSGSGKSTLMNIIGLLDHPTSGEYNLNGVNILESDSTRLAQLRNKHIGFVFQQFHLLPRLTALSNVELPLVYSGVHKKERRERALEALIKVGLADRINHLPNQLSGGQKQRAAIARSIINNPAVVLADEPTGALDSRSGEQVMDIFSQLNREGTTVIIVTHEDKVAAYTSRRIILMDGQIIEDKRGKISEFIGKY